MRTRRHLELDILEHDRIATFRARNREEDPPSEESMAVGAHLSKKATGAKDTRALTKQRAAASSPLSRRTTQGLLASRRSHGLAARLTRSAVSSGKEGSVTEMDQGDAETPPQYRTVQASVVSVSDLQAETLSEATLEQIRDAFGKDGLGIVALRGVEGLAGAREALLPLADALANLNQDQLGELEDEESSYSIGWSHGKETLEGGIPDIFKGSFYANPIHDVLDVTDEERKKYPSYTRPNIWPHDAIPGLRPALMRMGGLIVDHGKLLARACDTLTRRELGLGGGDDLGPSSIEGAIEDSFAAKARLLHYFPPAVDAESPSSSGQDEGKMGNWCGWHLDHGSLTGLTGAMFTDCAGGQVENPDPEKCGLYIKSRQGEIVRVTYAKDCIAYQVGEVSEIMSNGVLKATPHCVVGAEGEKAKGIARNTFAVFMQPKWDLALEVAEDKAGKGGVETKGYRPGISFGDFTQVKLDEYYS